MPGHVHCNARTGDRSDTDPRPAASTTPSVALTPPDIYGAYHFTIDATSGQGKTIAIVDAFHTPNAANDLATFSTRFGLPLCSGCLIQVGQDGGNVPTGYDDGWALEATLDIEWAHALAPAAKILLVEADSGSWTDMLAAVDYARGHADLVSMSWSGTESSTQTAWNSHFDTPGVSFFAASGDSGTPAEYPSASPNVVSVGGTTLENVNTDSLTETGWSGSGGGCSKYQTATTSQAAWYSYAQVNCKGKRATPDVSLDADPASGVAVYITGYYSSSTAGSWYRIGGTSAATPMWAGRAASQPDWDPTQIYQGLPQTRDITSGNNGASAKIGYDLVTGRGSWFDGPLPASQQPPTASFSTACSASTCTFKSTSTGGSLKYAWILSDTVIGTSATLKRSFSSTAVADYPITLKATNPYGASRVTHTVSCTLVSGTKVTCTQAPDPSPTS